MRQLRDRQAGILGLSKQHNQLEADTLDSAREQLNEKIKSNWENADAIILDETIISRGGTDTVRSSSDSYPTANAWYFHGNALAKLNQHEDAVNS